MASDNCASGSGSTRGSSFCCRTCALMVLQFCIFCARPTPSWAAAALGHGWQIRALRGALCRLHRFMSCCRSERQTVVPAPKSTGLGADGTEDFEFASHCPRRPSWRRGCFSRGRTTGFDSLGPGRSVALLQHEASFPSSKRRRPPGKYPWRPYPQMFRDIWAPRAPLRSARASASARTARRGGFALWLCCVVSESVSVLVSVSMWGTSSRRQLNQAAPREEVRRVWRCDHHSARAYQVCCLKKHGGACGTYLIGSGT